MALEKKKKKTQPGQYEVKSWREVPRSCNTSIVPVATEPSLAPGGEGQGVHGQWGRVGSGPQRAWLGPGVMWELWNLGRIAIFLKKKFFLICEIEPITPLSSSCYWCVDHNQNERAIWAFSKPRRVTDRACATMIVPPMIVSFGIEDGESMRRQNQTYSLENCISFVEPTTHFSSSQSCRNFRGPVRR